jgi:hypothetical protein
MEEVIMVRRVGPKMRHHCSTCGVVFDAPRTWAYCSKACERGRRGRDPSEKVGADEFLEPIYERRLQLCVELESAPAYERDRLRRMIAETDRQESAVREQLAAAKAPRSSAMFWQPLLGHAADQFETSMRRSLTCAIRLGRRLCEAKAALEHGEFGRLFADHPNPVPGALRIRSRWARVLMAIGANSVIANRHSNAVLPSQISTVYLLARMPEGELQRAIADGLVRPEMGPAEARRLLPAATETTDDLEQLLAPVRARLRRLAANQPDRFGELKSSLKAMLRAIEDELGSDPTEWIDGAARADMEP